MQHICPLEKQEALLAHPPDSLKGHLVSVKQAISWMNKKEYLCRRKAAVLCGPSKTF